eukprot:scaffold50205_cov42-Prasinocladus_malaysianus.AAC.1
MRSIFPYERELRTRRVRYENGYERPRPSAGPPESGVRGVEQLLPCPARRNFETARRETAATSKQSHPMNPRPRRLQLPRLAIFIATACLSAAASIATEIRECRNPSLEHSDHAADGHGPDPTDPGSCAAPVEMAGNSDVTAFIDKMNADYEQASCRCHDA